MCVLLKTTPGSTDDVWKRFPEGMPAHGAGMVGMDEVRSPETNNQTTLDAFPGRLGIPKTKH